MIRLATCDDLPVVEAINVFRGNRSEDIAEKRLVVFESSSTIVGFIVEARQGLLGRPFIEYLCVAEACRQQGVASALMAHMELKYARERLFVSTENTNTAMLKLLGKRGYCRAGVIAGANRNGADEIYFYRDGDTRFPGGIAQLDRAESDNT